MTVTCVYCTQELDPYAYGIFRKVEGWVQTREQGGAHGVTFRKELGEYAHEMCVALQRKNISVNQGSMF
jgi:hypothetical protein